MNLFSWRPPIYLFVAMMIGACADESKAPLAPETVPFLAEVRAKPEPNQYVVFLKWTNLPIQSRISKEGAGQKSELATIDSPDGELTDGAVNPGIQYTYRVIDLEEAIYTASVYVPKDIEIKGTVAASSITANRLFLGQSAVVIYQKELKVDVNEIHSQNAKVQLIARGYGALLPKPKSQENLHDRVSFQMGSNPSVPSPSVPDVPIINGTPTYPGFNLGPIVPDYGLSKYLKNLPRLVPNQPVPQMPLFGNPGPARNAGSITIRAQRAYGVLRIEAAGDSGANGPAGELGLPGKQGASGSKGTTKRVETSRISSILDRRDDPAPRPEPKPEPTKALLTFTYDCIDAPTNGLMGEAGSPGGDGRPGERGGDSAIIDIVVAEKGEFHVEVHSEPGRGGAGGRGGDGGDGGPGGQANPFPALGCKEAQPGVQGSRGLKGRDGSNGADGVRKPINIKS